MMEYYLDIHDFLVTVVHLMALETREVDEIFCQMYANNVNDLILSLSVSIVTLREHK